MTGGLANILTFDVEDWQQSTLDRSLPISDRVRDNTLRILDLLAEDGVRATFFVLGLVVEKFPDLARAITRAGHEVASHGYDHAPVRAMTPAAFKVDLRRCVALLEDATGARVLGYRAPDFSIGADSFWALEILAESGLAYDSSIYPFSGPRYGVAAAFAQPWRVRCAANPRFVEFPLTTWKILGRRVPAAGGGYFRVFPYAVTRAAIRRLNRAGTPATAYFHPYEIDTAEIGAVTAAIPWTLRLTQGLARGRVPAKLRRLLREFAWGPARSWLEAPAALTGSRVLDLTAGPRSPARWIADTVGS